MTPDTPDLLHVLRGLVAEVNTDIERWDLSRAYQVAGGPLLTVATRLGYPQADVFLSFTLAVRRLATMNRLPRSVPERRSFDRAMAHYEQQRAIVARYIDPAEVSR